MRNLKPKCSYKITDDNGRLIKKGKIRFFCPDFKDYSAFFKNFISDYSIKEQQYICKMIRFHILFPPNDLIAQEYINYNQMLEMGIFGKINLTKSNSNNLNDLLYQTVYNSKIFKLPMSQESYHSFRLMVLDELANINDCFNDDLNMYYDKLIAKSSFRKKLKLKLNNKKVKKAKEAALNEIYKLLNKECKESEKEIVSQKFYEEADALLKKFNKNHYKSLINRLTVFLNEEYEKYNSTYLLEEINYINSAQSLEERRNVLCWIFENTASRSDAFDLMKLDAEHIYLQCIDFYYKDYFYKTYKKMSREERRLFQLCYFRRDAFLGKIPVFDGFLQSFWENNIELILTGLVIKKNNPFYFEKNKELEKKWQEFLEIYPIAFQSAPIINKLNDKSKCLDLARKNFNNNEYLIINAFLDNHEKQTICARFDISFKECENLIKRFQKVVCESEEQD